MKRIRIKIFIFLSSVFVVACAYRIDKNPAGPYDNIQAKPKAPLTFALIASTVLEAKCLKCHSNATKNSGNVNLETYLNVRAALVDIKDDVISGAMPKAPGMPLSEEEKFLIMQWIRNGAPEVMPVEPSPTPIQTPTPAPTPFPDPPTIGLTPNFSSIFELIIKPKCLECHIEHGKANDTPFEKYEDIVTGFIVIPKNPDKSSFIKHITLGAKRLMPPPPPKSKYNALAPEDILIIRQWILDGALPN